MKIDKYFGVKYKDVADSKPPYVAESKSVYDCDDCDKCSLRDVAIILKKAILAKRWWIIAYIAFSSIAAFVFFMKTGLGSFENIMAVAAFILLYSFLLACFGCCDDGGVD